MSILCRLGIHAWEKEPSHKEFFRSTGIHFFFFSTGVQKAVRKCTRHGCCATQKVTRSGIVGAGGHGSGWKKLSKSKEAHIDSLPVL
jgi:hypothetical protein